MKATTLKSVLVIGVLLSFSQSFAQNITGGGQIGSAGNQFLLGRLLEASCNSPTGVAEIKVAVLNSETKLLNYVALNLVNDRLCIKDFKGFGQPISDMALSSVIGSDDGVSETARMHQITVNQNGIATNIREIVVQGEALETYRELNLLDLNSYPRVEKRVYNSESFDSYGRFDKKSAEIAAQVIELSK